IVRTWIDGFVEALAGAYEPGRAGALLTRYRDAFSVGYRDAYAPEVAVEDIHDIEALTPERPLGVDFFARSEDSRPCVGRKVWSDGYSALVIAAGLGWRDVALIRTGSRFLRQIRVPYSQDYMWATLRKHSALATKIVELFHARFDPHASGKAKQGDDDRGKSEAA